MQVKAMIGKEIKQQTISICVFSVQKKDCKKHFFHISALAE